MDENLGSIPASGPSLSSPMSRWVRTRPSVRSRTPGIKSLRFRRLSTFLGGGHPEMTSTQEGEWVTITADEKFRFCDQRCRGDLKTPKISRTSFMEVPSLRDFTIRGQPIIWPKRLVCACAHRLFPLPSSHAQSRL